MGSAESGVPTYRDAGGLWSIYEPDEVSSIKGFGLDARKVWSFESAFFNLLKGVKHNPAHRAIADLQCRVVTQNVDGLHQHAGSPENHVIEVHGSEVRAICLACKRTVPMESVVDGILEPEENKETLEIKNNMAKFHHKKQELEQEQQQQKKSKKDAGNAGGSRVSGSGSGSEKEESYKTVHPDPEISELATKELISYTIKCRSRSKKKKKKSKKRSKRGGSPTKRQKENKTPMDMEADMEADEDEGMESASSSKSSSSSSSGFGGNFGKELKRRHITTSRKARKAKKMRLKAARAEAIATGECPIKAVAAKKRSPSS